MATPAEGLARLRAAADAGELDALCRRHRIRVLTVFGSATRDAPAARDLDVGVLLERGVEIDYLPLIGDLQRITEANVDVVHLNPAAPVLRERALVGSVVLDESEPGAWASASTAAIQERMDTDWLRRLALDLLADPVTPRSSWTWQRASTPTWWPSRRGHRRRTCGAPSWLPPTPG